MFQEKQSNLTSCCPFNGLVFLSNRFFFSIEQYPPKTLALIVQPSGLAVSFVLFFF